MMTEQAPALLIELGSEELPPKALQQLADAFSRVLTQHLKDADVAAKDATITTYATPRRLAVHVANVQSEQASKTELRKGPAVQATKNADGDYTPAALGFARSCGVAIEQLDTLKTDKGEWLVYERTVSGKNLTELVQTALDAAIKQLPIPKRMRWGSNTVEFVRPVHWLLALHGNNVLPVSALGLTASNQTLGHRFHHPEAITVQNADSYAEQLLNTGYVQVSLNARKAQIKAGAEALAAAKGMQAVIDEDLLQEVSGLVEWAVPLMGDFDPAFLDVPREALIESMKSHQKYFYVVDQKQALQPHFITVSNIESSDPQRVVSGNERVLNARLADGAFFWKQDQLIPLSTHAKRLSGVTFHAQLGSLADKVSRLAALSAQIAPLLGADADKAKHAAQLCKADLVSDMVGEFPSLQGSMGHYYAVKDGVDAETAQAIEQHYWPKFSGDHLPQSAVADSVALADRLDTLVGIFATGEKPTGEKDPYALRRATLGVLRILIEKAYPIELSVLVNAAVAAYQQSPDIKAQPSAQTRDELLAFCQDRLKSLSLSNGYSAQVFAAVAGSEPLNVYDFDLRLQAVSGFAQGQAEAARALAAANKRTANILKKNEGGADAVNADKLEDKAEIDLYQALVTAETVANDAFNRGDYSQGLNRLSQLRQPIDDFFDNVMVMADDAELRANRLALLAQLRRLFLHVADISHLSLDK